MKTILPSHALGPLPSDRRMTTVDDRVVHAPADAIFRIAADVEGWPRHLPHYRSVRFRERRSDGGGTVEMSANRPFGVFNWPTWWTSLMSITPPPSGSSKVGAIRFRHVGGITTGMDVEWTFLERAPRETLVRIVHVWNGPRWPLMGLFAARTVIGPLFVHGIASRTLAGLGRAAERMTSHESSTGTASG